MVQGKYLITTNNWFVAPDGQTYTAVWGEVIILDDSSALGIKTNARATNWYARIGTEDNHIIVAGCQIFYAVKSEERPSAAHNIFWDTFEGKKVTLETPSKIYFTE